MTEAKVRFGEKHYRFYNKIYNNYTTVGERPREVNSSRVLSTGVDLKNSERAGNCSVCNGKGLILTPVKQKRGNATRYTAEICRACSGSDPI